MVAELKSAIHNNHKLFFIFRGINSLKGLLVALNTIFSHSRLQHCPLNRACLSGFVQSVHFLSKCPQTNFTISPTPLSNILLPTMVYKNLFEVQNKKAKIISTTVISGALVFVACLFLCVESKQTRTRKTPTSARHHQILPLKAARIKAFQGWYFIQGSFWPDVPKTLAQDHLS